MGNFDRVLRIGVAAIGPRRLPQPTCGSVPITSGPKDSPLYYVPGLQQGLFDHGWVEDKAEVITGPCKRFALDVTQGDSAAVKAAIEGQVRGGRHGVLVGISTKVVDICKAATLGKPIPILFPDISDPVGSGYAESLERPGHNITGVSPQLTQSTAQRLGYFHKLMGGRLKSVLAIYDPTFAPSQKSSELLRQAAAVLGIQVIERHLTTPDRREGVKAIMNGVKVGDVDGIFVLNDTNVISNADIVFDRANGLGIPIMGVHDFMAEWGAIGSYPSTPYGDGWDLSGYIDRIAAKGQHPATMPITVQKPHFAVNLARAACLGLSPDPETVAKADRIIR